ncbi:MAG TPA: hypothetical protein VHN16_16600 [Streptosporangiaceae bacterium]|nr:hypothetical protein [Streptosporangiaceae bacterium]
MYPEPVEHCAICRWRDSCRDRRRALAIIVASPGLIRVCCRTPPQMVLANALCRAWETGR